jgi:mannosyltransferase OCH1-like enzyme
LVEVYDGLVPFAYKSDLGRLCILYAFGGWYIDVSIRLQNPRPLSTNAASIFFRDLNKFTQSSWAVINGLVYSEANNPVFLSAIEMIIQNYKNRYYGMTPFCPTGPNLFGRAIAKHGLTPRMSFGDYVEMTPQHAHKNFAFLLPNGEIFAYPKSSGPGDLQQLGLKTGNNYVDLWKRKEIYR